MILLSIKDRNIITPEVDKLIVAINESLKPTNERIMDILASIKTNLGNLHNEDMEKYIRYQLKTIEDMIMYPHFVQWDGVDNK